MAAASIRLEPDYAITVWVAAGLCVFSIMFGVRNIDVNERHHGVIAAIALEAVVKLAALLADRPLGGRRLAGDARGGLRRRARQPDRPRRDLRRALGHAPDSSPARR